MTDLQIISKVFERTEKVVLGVKIRKKVLEDRPNPGKITFILFPHDTYYFELRFQNQTEHDIFDNFHELK
jgi:hypothetical protein